MSDELILQILADPTSVPDPYPLYRRLRESAPVHRMTVSDTVVVSRFDDCRRLLRDPNFGKAADKQAGTIIPGERSVNDLDRVRSMLFLDPPDHTRVRGLVSRAFTPRRIEQLRPEVEAMAATIVDELAEAGGGDVVEALSFPLPVRVIGALIGVPHERRDELRPLVSALATTLEPMVSDDGWRAAEAASVGVRAILTELIEQRRRHPADDLISVLLEATSDGDRLSYEELLSNVILMYAAGFETTTNLISNTILTLLRNPAQLSKVRADRGLVPGAIEEVLRYEPPVQFDLRRPLSTTEFCGEVIEPSTAVVALIAGANRDPAAIDRPDDFDVARPEVPLLSFASGIHYCLGAALARMEGQVVLETLLDRFEVWTLDEEPVWRPRMTLRGPERLVVGLN